MNFGLKGVSEIGKYDGRAIRWIDKMDHYELIFTDNFVTPSSGGTLFMEQTAGNRSMQTLPPLPPLTGLGSALLTDILLDMRSGDKSKEVHVFVGSFGGEVAALNMILQQLLTYEYRVGINLGAACSCGWMLLFACQERYVSPFSQAMYHDMSSACFGKHSELQSSAEFMARWQKELLKSTDTVNVLTQKELDLGRTSEVWLTGRELIERGAAKDYTEYLNRRTPVPAHGAFLVGGTLYQQDFDGKWYAYKKAGGKGCTWPELLKKSNEKPKMPKRPGKPQKSDSSAEKPIESKAEA